MKKLLLMAALTLGCISLQAQETLNLSTYQGTNLNKYVGKQLTVSVTRYVFNGWNTISLPFSISETQVNEVFGADCQLEKLVGVENDGISIRLNFQDCKAEGIRANVPYILHYTGESGSKKIVAKNVSVTDATASVTFTAQGTGETVTMACAKHKTAAQGLYGILAKDNANATFVNVDGASNGFLATRCYIQLSNGNSTILTTNHIGGDVTAISTIVKAGEQVDVYNLSGVKVANNINDLQKGIYVVKGKKVMVK